MDNQVIEAAELAGSVNADDFSMINLFLRADLVVKLVVAMLILTSIWCWGIIFEKLVYIRRMNKDSSHFEKRFWSGNSLDQLFDQLANGARDPMSLVFVAAMREWRRAPSEAAGFQVRVGVTERIERVMQITLVREMERAERYMTFLATTGSTAPFIGLFGTVWGIMNSFQSIAAQNNTSLAVVAPGIAEALFATALGLLAAIPAVVAYNKISRDLDRYSSRLEAFAGEFSAILSRELDSRG
ncbi:MAG: Biopolymer transport protein ExbB [Alphaproteobacteria bacterium MarineAlpha3_Bin5]|nr:MAG: Biopolymer transport protein ExbB [Alphaproteobacteria bacterium MarineAlpha3_Bin5]